MVFPQNSKGGGLFLRNIFTHGGGIIIKMAKDLLYLLIQEIFCSQAAAPRLLVFHVVKGIL